MTCKLCSKIVRTNKRSLDFMAERCVDVCPTIYTRLMARQQTKANNHMRYYWQQKLQSIQKSIWNNTAKETHNQFVCREKLKNICILMTLFTQKLVYEMKSHQNWWFTCKNQCWQRRRRSRGFIHNFPLK